MCTFAYNFLDSWDFANTPLHRILMGPIQQTYQIETDLSEKSEAA